MSTTRTRIVCNPVDLAYRFQELSPLGGMRTVYREAADPSIVRYRGRYYLFASMSGGFWHSDDLAHWQYRASEALPPMDYAPDVREIGGALVVSASRTTDSPFFRSVDPLSDDFTQVNSGFAFWDPHLLEDVDGKAYFYWGCSNSEPIRGAEIDPRTFDVIGPIVPLLYGSPTTHGWEQTGEDYVKSEPSTEQEREIAEYFGDAPFIEGAWVTLRDGVYYLQYAGPGTELNTYADGYYTGASPLGPFTYSEHSPFSSKPGGFITAAGHGSTVEDEYGNWWHAATMRISMHHPFERRIGLFPSGFDDDGVLFCNQNFSDYPMVIPSEKVDPWTGTSTGWMLQSLHADASASSSVPGHGPELAVNEDIRSWWVAGSEEPGEWLRIDMGSERTVHALQVNAADHDLAALAPWHDDRQEFPGEYRAIYTGVRPTEYTLELSADGEEWEVIVDTVGAGIESPHAFEVLDPPRRARFVRFTATSSPFGAPSALSGLRVFGFGDGEAPIPTSARGVRRDSLTAHVEWESSPTAHGYNIRYGIAPDKLYHSWLVYSKTDLDLRNLNAGIDYWFAVDAFNENGVTPGAVVAIASVPDIE